MKPEKSEKEKLRNGVDGVTYLKKRLPISDERQCPNEISASENFLGIKEKVLKEFQYDKGDIKTIEEMGEELSEKSLNRNLSKAIDLTIEETAKEIKEGLEKIIFWFDYGLSKRKFTFGKFAKIYFKKDWEQFWKEFEKK